MRKLRISVAAALLGLIATVPSHAVVITFTGGTATFHGGGTGVTSNGPLYSNVDYYEESGFRYNFLPNVLTPSSSYVGVYYGGVANDVIHAHWDAGDFGQVTLMEITKIGGGTFDLNYFVLTSNTHTGGGAASGTEQTWVEGFVGGVSTGTAVLLPPENWGFPAVPVFLGSAFDAVDTVRFFVTSAVDCFGMDEFFIDEPAPGGEVPEPMSLAIWGAMGAAGVGLVAYRKRSRCLAD